MSIELIVFDLAGTTVKDNKDVHRVLQEALAQHDVAITIEDANAVMGIPKPVAIRGLLEKRYSGESAITPEWIEDIHRTFVSGMIHFYKTDKDVGEIAGVTETFRKLKERKLKIVVDTGFDRQITKPLLKRLAWEENGLIDASITSDEVKRGRPYPDMIFRAMELTGISNPAVVAKVGDTVYDLMEGSSAGCKLVIGITTGAFSKNELQQEKHTHLIEHISDVVRIIEAES